MKDQIVAFNYLVDQQCQLLQKLNMASPVGQTKLGVHSLPLQTWLPSCVQDRQMQVDQVHLVQVIQVSYCSNCSFGFTSATSSATSGACAGSNGAPAAGHTMIKDNC